jgi:hypothetical protein
MEIIEVIFIIATVIGGAYILIAGILIIPFTAKKVFLSNYSSESSIQAIFILFYFNVLLILGLG